MYKVVIIDDEPIIVRGLSQMLPWAAYGCEVAGTAANGLEGLEVIRTLRPDLVFTDIYMPKMDGLAMAAAMKSEYEDMEVTVLTGYRDFELAQQAIRLGVRRFLLKPSNMEELEEAVQAMTEHLRRRGIRGGQQAEAGSDLNAASGSLQAEAGSDLDSTHGTRISGTGADAEEKKADAAGSFLVKKALAYMQENYSRKLALTEVAENIYVSQWHLSKLLNRHTNQSFSELLNSIRIEEAKRLLDDPALRISDVAELVGFADVAHFSRVFKKMTGVSANEYRNSAAM